MTMLRILFDVILKLSDSPTTENKVQLDKEIRGLMETGTAGWLSEEALCGSEGLELVWALANETQRNAIEESLLTLLPIWRKTRQDSRKSKIALAGLWSIVARLNPPSGKIFNAIAADRATVLDELSDSCFELKDDFPEDWAMAGYFNFWPKVGDRACEYKHIGFDSLTVTAFESNKPRSEIFSIVGQLLIGALEKDQFRTVTLFTREWLAVGNSLDYREIEMWSESWLLQIENLAGHFPKRALDRLLMGFYLFSIKDCALAKSKSPNLAIIARMLDRLLGLGGCQDGVFVYVFDSIAAKLSDRDSYDDMVKMQNALSTIETEVELVEPKAATLLQVTRQAIENAEIDPVMYLPIDSENSAKRVDETVRQHQLQIF